MKASKFSDARKARGLDADRHPKSLLLVQTKGSAFGAGSHYGIADGRLDWNI